MKRIFIVLIAFIGFSGGINAQLNLCAGEQVCLVAGSFHGNIQWQSSPDMMSWANLPSATTDTFCFTLAASGYYRAVITEGTCDLVYSDTTYINMLSASSGVDTFFYTGALQQFIVSGSCMDSVTITCYGAQGGPVTAQSPFPQGGMGAIMQGKFNVSSGDTLDIIVGARGNPDPSSSGGGGGSGVVLNGTPWIIAGGGAGVDFQDPGYPGQHAVITNDGVVGSGGGGAGGTAGGDGGGVVYSGNNFSWGGRGFNAGATGSTGQNGASPNTTYTNGTFGLGGGGGSVGYGWCNCGAGGGGYSGGGSGQINATGGGGGSYNVGVNQVNTPGTHTGNGMIIITW